VRWKELQQLLSLLFVISQLVFQTELLLSCGFWSFCCSTCWIDEVDVPVATSLEGLLFLGCCFWEVETAEGWGVGSGRGLRSCFLLSLLDFGSGPPLLLEGSLLVAAVLETTWFFASFWFSCDNRGLTALVVLLFGGELNLCFEKTQILVIPENSAWSSLNFAIQRAVDVSPLETHQSAIFGAGRKTFYVFHTVFSDLRTDSRIN